MAPAPALATIADVAEILGVSVRTAHRLSARSDFPTPTETRHGRVWKKSEVVTWGRRPPVPLGRRGRPPKA